MPTNPYFKFQPTEQNVTEDIAIEIIRMMGKELWYIPREFVNLDRLFGEDQLNRFTKAYPIEMYIVSYSGFDGGEVISKFGIENKDRMTVVLSKKRFNKEVTTNDISINRPREGDLIYFPLSKTLFEINFVEHELPFYQLDKNYVFTLTCETFTYSAENFNTGNETIDSVNDFKQNIYDFLINAQATGFNAAYNSIIRGGKYSITGNIAGTTAYFRLLDYSLSGNTLTTEFMSLDGITFTSSIIRNEVNGLTFSVNTKNASGDYAIVNTILDDDAGEVPPMDYQRGFTGSGSKFDMNIIDFTETDPFSEGNY
jgi:hypothetical protein